MILYSYWRSTTSFRVRAALNLKGVPYEIKTVDLVAGDQRADSYTALNPGGGVPTLVLDDGTVLTQSMAILDYIENTRPEPRLIPQDPVQRARVMALADAVALDIHPVNNLKVVAQIKERFGATAEQAQEWMQHWMRVGFAAIEAQIDPNTSFALGETPNLADLCIVGQTVNAHRWGVDLAPFPKIARVEQACLAVQEIAAGHPDQQPEAKSA